MKEKTAKWLDEIKLASMGIVLQTKDWRFWAIFLPIFVAFGTLLSLLAAGTGAIDLFFVSDFSGKMQVLADGFLGFFGKDRYFWDFLQNFVIAFLQALLITLIILVYKKRKQKALKQKQIKNKHKQGNEKAEAIQNAGIAAGLALLGSGCPTCGTTLITPILASIFSSSGYAIAGTVSGIITAIAIILLLWSLKRVGFEAYAIIIDERWRKKRLKEAKEEDESS